MDAATKAFVRARAGGRCEYCLISQRHIDLPHHIEHIVAKQHLGGDSLDNLAVACVRCNLCKGPNVSGVDPESREIVRLFNPRRDEWAAHFTFRDCWIVGLTPVGRATVHVLGMNEVRRLELRAVLIARGAPL